MSQQPPKLLDVEAYSYSKNEPHATQEVTMEETQPTKLVSLNTLLATSLSYSYSP